MGAPTAWKIALVVSRRRAVVQQLGLLVGFQLGPAVERNR